MKGSIIVITISSINGIFLIAAVAYHLPILILDLKVNSFDIFNPHPNNIMTIIFVFTIIQKLQSL